ncbi:hypothetical protein RHSIM_Rhsim10G0096500 [Rhododendron simsii]|uniref:Integrase zinc-binding domain-containing protein n=1 Tax=Rhododendron simsii TaxID=118357 RepID=A0A834LE88_RHOSS|nr:hypothetical protein RHSIM_Rhsim10G0096500 [Rhododendron simsii]
MRPPAHHLIEARGYPAKRSKYNEPPPLPVTAAEAQAFLDAWVQDGKVTLPEARKEPTRRDMEHPDYCIYHRMVRHPTKDCWGLRTLFEKFMVEEAVELMVTKDVLRNPLPNHKVNGKAVMMHAPRSENRHPDALATLASKVEVSGTPTKIEILKRSVPCSIAEIFPEEEIEDSRTPISNELKSTSAAVTLSNLKHFTIYQGVLYYRGSGRLLAVCIGEEEAKVKIQEVHERYCGTGDVSLYRRLQRQGYYWPTMATDAAELQNKCPKCRETPSKAECNFIGVYTDWRKPYIDFLTDGTLPPDRPKFFIHNEELFRRSFERKPLKCLTGPETLKALEAAHEAKDQGGAKLFQHLLHVGYYWPTMEEDAKNHVKRCKAYQVHRNMIHAPAVDLRAIRTPWPFHTWGMDLIGPINPLSRGNIWILTALELYTKWVEVVPLKRATGAAVSNFIREHIIC